jgi:excisionase family DNA binding protein
VEALSMVRPYSVAEAAEMLGLNAKTLYSAIKQGQVPSTHIGKRILIPRAAFDRLLAEGGKVTA